MKKAAIERYVAAVLFVLVLVVFSLAERDTRKLSSLYRQKTQDAAALRAAAPLTIGQALPSTASKTP